MSLLVLPGGLQGGQSGFACQATASGHGSTMYVTMGSSRIVARVVHLSAGKSDKVCSPGNGSSRRPPIVTVHGPAQDPLAEGLRSESLDVPANRDGSEPHGVPAELLLSLEDLLGDNESRVLCITTPVVVPWSTSSCSSSIFESSARQRARGFTSEITRGEREARLPLLQYLGHSQIDSGEKVVCCRALRGRA